MRHAAGLRRGAGTGAAPACARHSAPSVRHSGALAARRWAGALGAAPSSLQAAAAAARMAPRRIFAQPHRMLSVALGDAGAAVAESRDGPLYVSGKNQRNIAVIAHVDHGKTSLVDKLLRFTDATVTGSMDSNDLERERGITILAKCTSLTHKGVLFNIVDTPGHADFGGEVERILSMVDGVLLVVDALDGPMPQTRYVLGKALSRGLKPVVVLNKCDRDGARIGIVENEVLDLFVALDASDDQLDFPIVYASAREGWAVPDLAEKAATSNMGHLLDVLAEHVPAPRVLGGASAPFSMLVSQMEGDQYMGKLVLGRVSSGSIRAGDALVALDREGRKTEEGKVTRLFARRGMAAVPLDVATAGDIVQVAGFSTPVPTSTLAAPGTTRPLFAEPLDPPTLSMCFGVNDSPLGGREGTMLTSSAIVERLARESSSNISLQVSPGPAIEGMPDATEVRGRGELQMAVLIENMRREGFELSVSPPAVLFSTDATGEKTEPYEHVLIDVDDAYSGSVIERMAQRKAAMDEFSQLAPGKVRLTFKAPSRGLIGFQSELKTETRGSAIMHRVFDGYGPYVRGLDRKTRSVLVSQSSGAITAYALDMLQARGTLFVRPGDPTYVGHIIGECSRDSLYDMDVNPVKGKKLTNVRAAGNDEAVRLAPPRLFPLEEAVVYVAADELVEVTPTVIRLRKRILDPDARDRASRSQAKAFRADQANATARGSA